MDLQEEQLVAEKFLKGKVVKSIFRHRANELCIEFTDGTRLFVDKNETGLELSVTSGKLDEL